MDDEIKAVGVYRHSGTKELVVGYSDGSKSLLGDVEGDDYRAALSAVAKASKSGTDVDGTDWYARIEPTDGQKQKYDDNDRQGSDDESGGDNEHQEDGDQSGENGQGEGDAGEGDADQEGDPQEGDADGDNQEDGEMDESFDGRDQTGEDDELENEFAQTLWELIQPRVREMDRHAFEHQADVFAKKLGDGGGRSGGGLTLKFEKGRVGKVDGVTHEMFPRVLAAVHRGVNVYLPGTPGTGKSHMVEQIAEALAVPFGVTSFSPMSTESKLLGFRNANGDTVRTVFRDRYEFGGVMLLDELDNANGAIIAVMNGGLANGQMEFPDGVVKKHPDFVAIATANTLGTGPTAEFSGRQKLDPATLNRFVKFFIDTDETMEDAIVHGMIGLELGSAWLKKVRHVRRAILDLRIKHFCTMRDSINGARMIAPGDGAFSQLEALTATVLGVLPEDQVDKIKAWRG